MKSRTYSVLALASWSVFWIRIWKDLPSYWFLISFLIGFLALLCTMKLETNYAFGWMSDN
jgi:hypothetical protein